MSAYLSARHEKLLEQRRGAGLPDASIDLRRVMAGWLAEKTRPMLDGAAFGIRRAEIKPADAGEGDCRGAHGTRLKRHIEVAVNKTLAVELGASRPDRDQLGMGRWIAKLERAVAGTRQHLASSAHQHGPDRDLAGQARGLSFGEGQVHGSLAWAHHICKLLPHHG